MPENANPASASGSTGTQSGTTNGGTGGGTSQSNTTQQREVVYVNADIDRIVQRHGAGNKDAALKNLWRDNKKARDKNAELTAQLDAAKKAAEPKPGEVRLTGDDAKTWEIIKGKKPEEVATLVKEHGELKAKDAVAERRKVHDTAAKNAGYKNTDAFHDLVESKQLKVSLKTETVDGKQIDVPYVTPPGDNAQPVRLSEYATAHLAIYAPALMTPPATGTAGNGGTTGTTGTTAQSATENPRRVPIPFQSSAATTTGTTDVKHPVDVIRQTRVLPSQRGEKKD